MFERGKAIDKGAQPIAVNEKIEDREQRDDDVKRCRKKAGNKGVGARGEPLGQAAASVEQRLLDPFGRERDAEPRG